MTAAASGAAVERVDQADVPLRIGPRRGRVACGAATARAWIPLMPLRELLPIVLGGAAIVLGAGLAACGAPAGSTGAS
ncbi:hypothetical protein BE15_28760, partial [Sorangium cellulosum]